MNHRSQKYINWINSPRWKELRNYLFALLPHKVCARSGCPHYPSECHHLHYRTLGRETLADVEFLCPEHHRLADKERDRLEEVAAEKRQEEKDRSYLENARKRWARRKYGADWEKKYTDEFIDAEFEQYLDRVL